MASRLRVALLCLLVVLAASAAAPEKKQKKADGSGGMQALLEAGRALESGVAELLGDPLDLEEGAQCSFPRREGDCDRCSFGIGKGKCEEHWRKIKPCLVPAPFPVSTFLSPWPKLEDGESLCKRCKKGPGREEGNPDEGNTYMVYEGNPYLGEKIGERMLEYERKRRNQFHWNGATGWNARGQYDERLALMNDGHIHFNAKGEWKDTEIVSIPRTPRTESAGEEWLKNWYYLHTTPVGASLDGEDGFFLIDETMTIESYCEHLETEENDHVTREQERVDKDGGTKRFQLPIDDDYP